MSKQSPHPRTPARPAAAVKLLKLQELETGTVRTVWRMPDGSRRQTVIPATAYDEGTLAQLHRRFERQEGP